MVTPKQEIEAGAATRRKVFIAVGLMTALLVAGMIYWALRPHTPNNSNVQPHLAGALRVGSPQFEQLRQSIKVEFIPDEDAYEAARPLGDIVMELHPKVRNFTGHTITGLELQATVVDLENKPVQTRTFVFPHPPQTEFALENNKVLEPALVLEGFKKSDLRANVRIDVTGVIVQ
ncbi:MAG: hypothetical protein DMF64_20165 [Acidobacteria bacterium]|nr:MAG: hypothetical protein DMF64_20165 [Acidobacteriota bacterium]